MEYQKTISVLEKIQNQPSKFRTKNWVEINNESGGTNNTNSKFKTSMLSSNLYDYRDTYILVKGTIIVVNTAATDVNVNNNNAEVVFNKTCAPFTDCTS